MRCHSLILFLLMGLPAAAFAARLEGRLVDPQGRAIGGATVVLAELGTSAVTDVQGRYEFTAVAAGTYHLTFRLGEHAASATVTVEESGQPPIETAADWQLGFAETITVTAASRQVETLAAAPASVSLVTAEEAAQRPANGQVPTLLAFSPGVDLTQSGLFDFNLNTRGFNTAVNPRVLTLIDGRDPSLPGVGSQEWAALSFPPDELDRIELVRGPGSALYGAGAYNGVLDLATRDPRDSLGGRVRVTGGDLATRRLEVRQAGPLGHETYFKLLGGYYRSRDFARSRVGTVEYAPGLLPEEVIPPPRDRVEIAFGEVRLDKYFGARSLTLDLGDAQHQGIVTVADVGRTQQQSGKRPWGRLRLGSAHWNVQAFYTGQKADDIRSLGSGEPLFLDSSRAGIDAQAEMGFLSRGSLLGGASFSRESLDSADPQGRQTIFSRKETADRRSLYGQVEYPFGDAFKAVVAARWDEGDLYDAQISPRMALAWSVSPRHTLRFSYSRGFQSPAFADVFLRAAVAAPLDLSPLEAALAPLLGGVPLGFESIPILAVGNEDIKSQKSSGSELGYTGIFGRDVLLTLGVYRNRLSDFSTNLLPQVGTSLGRLNARFAPYHPPSSLSAAASAAVLAALRSALPPELLASLSNDADGSPVLVLLSATNAGQVDVRGAELAATYSWRQRWLLDFNYDYFDFTIREQAPESPLTPNTPRHRLALGLTYRGERSSAALKVRRVQRFDWASGIFVGPVPAYGVVDLAANSQLRPGWEVGVDVANLLDHEHYEIFGGDLLRRRALLYVSHSW